MKYIWSPINNQCFVWKIQPAEGWQLKLGTYCWTSLNIPKTRIEGVMQRWQASKKSILSPHACYFCFFMVSNIIFTNKCTPIAYNWYDVPKHIYIYTLYIYICFFLKLIKLGGTSKSSIFFSDFPWNKPSISLGVTMFWDKAWPPLDGTFSPCFARAVCWCGRCRRAQEQYSVRLPLGDFGILIIFLIEAR